jgi:hypothetical protein
MHDGVVSSFQDQHIIVKSDDSKYAVISPASNSIQYKIIRMSDKKVMVSFQNTESDFTSLNFTASDNFFISTPFKVYKNGEQEIKLKNLDEPIQISQVLVNPTNNKAYVVNGGEIYGGSSAGTDE